MGFYCHHCGQANTEPSESFWSMVQHFFNDITHFDGRFFFTMKYLFRRPGFLPREFVEGRRARYLDPYRMYIFTSAIFFLIFFNLFSPSLQDNTGSSSPSLMAKDTSFINQALANAKSSEDSASIMQAFGIIIRANADSSRPFPSIAEYRQKQQALAPAAQDGWFKRRFTEKKISWETRLREDNRGFVRDFFRSFLHTLPYLLFVSLPLFALFLKWIHPRNIPFAHHAMFLVYLYIFTFAILLFAFALGKMEELSSFHFFSWLHTLTLFLGLVYTLKAFKNFYGGSWAGVILRFIVFNMMSSILIIFLFLLFMGITLFII